MKRLDIQDADIYEGRLSETYFQQLLDETPWSQGDVTVYGKTFSEPRLTAWYGDSSYTYANSNKQPHKLTPLLETIKQEVELMTDCYYNSCLLNLYRDGKDSIGLHSDDEREITNHIASVSFGWPRILRFVHKRQKYPEVQVNVDDRHVLFMTGDTQDNWKHGINKCRNANPRINVTFRQLKYK